MTNMQFVDKTYNFIWEAPNAGRYAKHTLSQNNSGNIIPVPDKMIHVEGPHVICSDDKELTFIEQSADYTFSKNLNINTNLLKPKIVDFCAAFDIDAIKTVLEVGGGFGSSTLWLAKNITHLEQLDVIERKIDRYNLIVNRVIAANADTKVHIYNCDARWDLPKPNYTYDLIFFDLSHHFNTDSQVVDALVSLITPSTILIFDDYELDDVKHVVAHAREKLNCKIFVKCNDIVEI